MTSLDKGVVLEQHTQLAAKIWLALTSCFSFTHGSLSCRQIGL